MNGEVYCYATCRTLQRCTLHNSAQIPFIITVAETFVWVHPHLYCHPIFLNRFLLITAVVLRWNQSTALEILRKYTPVNNVILQRSNYLKVNYNCTNLTCVSISRRMRK